MLLNTLNVLALEDYEITSYADDTTPFHPKGNHKDVIEESEQSLSIFFTWFQNNYMKFKTDKSHLLFSWKIKINADFDENKIQTTNQKHILGVIIDFVSQSKYS